MLCCCAGSSCAISEPRHYEAEAIPEGFLVVVGVNGRARPICWGCTSCTRRSPRASASEPLVRHGASSGFSAKFQTRGKVLVEAEVKTKGANKVQ